MASRSAAATATFGHDFGSVRVHAGEAPSGAVRFQRKEAGTPATSSAPAPAAQPSAASTATAGPKFTDCTATQEAAIRQGITDAHGWLAATITALSASPLDPATVSLLNAHFKTSSPADVATILSNFRRIEAEIGSSSAAYECEDWSAWCLIGSAYTDCPGGTAIHICSDVFALFAALMARTVIHETAHRIGLCGDLYCDAHATKYQAMTKATAIDNADTYPAFSGELTGKYLC